MMTMGGLSRLKSTSAYLVMLAGSLGAFSLINQIGGQLSAPPPILHAGSAERMAPTAGGHALLHVLMSLVAIVVVARLVSAACRFIGQPPVIGEVVAGIMLGPSLIGRFAPSAQHLLLPQEAVPLLGIIGQVGVVLFMFLVGLEFDPSVLKKRGHASVAISHASIVTPFVLGGSLALVLYPRFSSSDVPFFIFALFMGVSMSITAFPVLARILTDRKMQTTNLGVLALTCAAVDDVTAWTLLGLVVTIARHGSIGQALLTFVLAGAFIGFMMVVGQRAVLWLVKNHKESQEGLTQKTLAVVLVGVLLSAVTTEAIGVHALFGAFLFGVIMPNESKLAKDIEGQVSNLVLVLFLPAFFAFTGMRTQLGLIGTTTEWLFCGAIIAIAVLGKFGGSFAAAQATGLGWRDSLGIGALMNTRGLMELIVLNLGLDLGVISPQIFAMMVVMALATTFMTTPVLFLLRRRPEPSEALSHSSRSACRSEIELEL